jgi:hypothetical protein
MFSKLTRPFTATSTDYSLPTLFKEIKRDALIIVDNTMLYTLVTAVVAAVEGGYFHRCGVVVLINISVATNNDEPHRPQPQAEVLVERRPSCTQAVDRIPDPDQGGEFQHHGH